MDKSVYIKTFDLIKRLRTNGTTVNVLMGESIRLTITPRNRPGVIYEGLKTEQELLGKLESYESSGI